MITSEEHERMVELVLGNRYIALATVTRFLRPEVFIDADGPSTPSVRRAAKRDFMAEVKGALDDQCSEPNARVGKLSQEDAQNYLLHGNVYYSTEWMAHQMETDVSLTVAGQVGLSIYEELQDIFEQLCKITGLPKSALADPSVAVLARMGVRNHQDIVVAGDYSSFLDIAWRKRDEK